MSHPDDRQISIDCAVITVSDTRTLTTDSSGALAGELLAAAGHTVSSYQIIPDQPALIISEIDRLKSSYPQIAAIMINGGTGIAERDTTYDAIARLLVKTLPGFGELFRALSYAEIGTKAMASRAVAGTYGDVLIFSLPGSTGAVRLGMEKLILPEIVHLVKLLRDL
jgi:molybdopterin adenylyltransferase